MLSLSSTQIRVIRKQIGQKMNLSGKIVIMTGASRGIGAASAKEFAQKGAIVILAAQDEQKLAHVAREIGSAARVHVLNIAKPEQVEKMISQTLNEFGKIDIVVNNAGRIKPIQRLVDIKIEDWNNIIDVNLKGVFYGFKLAIPSMLKSGGGTFLTLSSGAAHNPLEAWSHYCASKAAVNMLIRCVDLEYRHYGIRSIGLSPGTVATNMQREIKKSKINQVSQLEWSAHIDPKWPAKALVWLASYPGNEYLGKEVSLRDEAIRQQIGMV